MSVELYRQGKLAESLVEALDVLVEEGKIPGPLALKVMEEASGGGGGAGDARGRRQRCASPPQRTPTHTQPACPQYDSSIVDTFNTRVTSKAVFKGKLDVYRYCDNVRGCPSSGRCALCVCACTG